jgi:preprotein translocase subunit YajC
MQPGDRVALRRGGWEGKVDRVQSGARVHVEFDNGGSGLFPEADLVRVGNEDKAWPPRNLEAK